MAKANRKAWRTLATAGFDVMRKPTRRHEFLQMMNRVMPWAEMMKLIEPFYPKSGVPGRLVNPLIRMVKLFCLRLWYVVSAPRIEKKRSDSEGSRGFGREWSMSSVGGSCAFGGFPRTSNTPLRWPPR